MLNFIITNIIGYIFILIINIINSGFTMDIFVKTFQLFILFNIGAATSILNILNLNSTEAILASLFWIILIIFAIYLFKSDFKYKIYLWGLFIILWLLLGMYNPQFRA